MADCLPDTATCTLVGAEPVCKCIAGHLGDGVTSCVFDEACAALGCDENASCASEGETLSCACDRGFTGDGLTCTNMDDCVPEACENGGTCVDGVDSFTCECPEGFEGERCEVNIDACAEEPCFNGGTCADEVEGFTCDCTGTGYSGEQCQTDEDHCTPNPCQHGGTCDSSATGYVCDCSGTGYGGQLCEEDTNDCTATSCMNGGICVDGVNEITCLCDGTGFAGARCEMNVDDCSSNPCENGGKCTDAVNGVTCDCSGTNYQGEFCTEDIDECRTANPCGGNQTCRNIPGDYECECKVDYNCLQGEGTHCLGTSARECTKDANGCVVAGPLESCQPSGECYVAACAEGAGCGSEPKPAGEACSQGRECDGKGKCVTPPAVCGDSKVNGSEECDASAPGWNSKACVGCKVVAFSRCDLYANDSYCPNSGEQCLYAFCAAQCNSAADCPQVANGNVFCGAYNGVSVCQLGCRTAQDCPFDDMICESSTRCTYETCIQNGSC